MSREAFDKKAFERLKKIASDMEPAPWTYNQLRSRFENADGDGQGHWWNAKEDSFVQLVRNHWDGIQQILESHFAKQPATLNIEDAAKELDEHIGNPKNWTVGIAAPDTLILYKRKRQLKCPIKAEDGWNGFKVEVHYMGPIKML